MLAWTANNAVGAINVPSPRSSSSLFACLTRWTLVIFSLLTTVLADNANTTLLPSVASDSFPACGFSCSLIQQAQSGCVPPKAPENDYSVYVSCFCQSTLISQLHNSPDGTCDDSCTSSSDRSLLQTWFNNFCSSGGNNIEDDTSADSSATTTDSPVMAANTGSSSAGVTTIAPRTWWEGHYQWVIMVIVLAVAFTVIIIVGVWLKRRHDAKYPNLYHSNSGSGNNSGLLNTRSPEPPQPGVRSQALAPPRFPIESDHTDSVASSSRTEVAAPKTRSNSSKLQKPPGGV